jgi:CheY-like chemotaxis protein
MTVDPDLPARVVLDGRHVRQILLNLLGNAIKFTQQGGVSLEITAAERDLSSGALAKEDGVRFMVSDTGPGIAPEELTKIFDAFTQTDAGAAAGGTGLGLTISRHLLDNMGAELNVESTVGNGSRFFFTLPLVFGSDEWSDQADDRPSLHARLAPGQQVTALVVDDNTVSRRILASLLESAGLQVITATGGLEAIALAKEHQPNVVFMDVKMADLDGFSATRRLAADASTRHIPVIAVTASTLGDTRTAAREAGCVAYLPKPVRAEALFAALATHLMLTFDWDTAPEAPPDAVTIESRHAPLAARLRDAVAIGAVTDLHALAGALTSGDERDAALGRRISTLAANFDFDGIRELAESLDSARHA